MRMPPARAGIWLYLACVYLTCASLAVTAGPAQTRSPEFALELSETQHAQLDALRSAREHGLEPADYGVAALENMISNGSSSATEWFAEQLDSAFRRYATDINLGRLSPLTDPDWHIPRRTASEHGPATTIDEIEGLPPPHPDYARLQNTLITYQAIRENGGWEEIPPGPELSIGTLHPHAELARNRLRITNDYDAMTPANSHLFDLGLDEATRNFQVRHGLLANGIIDNAMREIMNIPVDDRIEQLTIAMERWRWLPRDLGEKYVWINAADAMLNIVVDGEPVLSMRTIVGHSTRPTPSLQSEIRRVEFNPVWSVPYSIATKDLLPKVRNNPGFLARNHFRVYAGGRDEAHEVDPSDIDWAAVQANKFPYRFIQKPGPTNSLGRVKVVFNNPYDIYIHDTPAKGLFSLRTRTFSSGCVRLEKAVEFASALLAYDRNWSNKDTRQHLDTGRTRGINLQHKVPIYVVYITSWVTEDGQAHFRRDLYKRDAAVEMARLIITEEANIASERSP